MDIGGQSLRDIADGRLRVALRIDRVQLAGIKVSWSTSFVLIKMTRVVACKKSFTAAVSGFRNFPWKDVTAHQKRELYIDFRNERGIKEQFELAENIGDSFPWYSWWILSRAGPVSAPPNTHIEPEPSTPVRRDGGNYS